jgi:hypothetical protein
MAEESIPLDSSPESRERKEGERGAGEGERGAREGRALHPA